MRTGSGIAAFTNLPTNDGRLIKQLTVRDLPLPISTTKYVADELLQPGHSEASVCGKIITVQPLGNALFVSTVIEDWAAEQMEVIGGDWFLQADMDEVGHPLIGVHEDGRFTYEYGHARLAGAFLGKNPAWPDTLFRINP